MQSPIKLSGDLIECPLCGLDPISALSAGFTPPTMPHPGWIRCDCRGPRPYNVQEALAARAERSNNDQLTRDIRDCWFEDVHRPHEPGSSSGSSGRDKSKPKGRPEQKWHGFPIPDLTTTEHLENLTEPIKGSLPAYLLDRLKQQATTTESRELRWLISQHLDLVDQVPQLERGGRKRKFKLLLSPSNIKLWNAKKADLRASSSELLAAILLKEWI